MCRRRRRGQLGSASCVQIRNGPLRTALVQARAFPEHPGAPAATGCRLPRGRRARAALRRRPKAQRRDLQREPLARPVFRKRLQEIHVETRFHRGRLLRRAAGVVTLRLSAGNRQSATDQQGLFCLLLPDSADQPEERHARCRCADQKPHAQVPAFRTEHRRPGVSPVRHRGRPNADGHRCAGSPGVPGHHRSGTRRSGPRAGRSTRCSVR